MARLVRNFTATAFCVIALSVATGATALASGETFQSPTTGQPGAPTNTCGTANPMTPGASATSPGSPFNAAGQAGVVYAGNPSTASLANSNSGATVSQYDAACVRLSSH
ncbi:MAG TPA: hypothetical protein VKF16_05860 [Candidatus Dormibacteraeota bacterium]|nr:hypothetical protein [Candidatus Dormibacteraeota bacterium]